jgi:hypothetical protein
MADVFEGRECQFGEGPRRMLREFYDRAQVDAGKNAGPGASRATAASRAKVGGRVRAFSDLKVGDVFQNDHLVGERRCRRVVRVMDHDNVETEYVSTRDKSVERTEVYSRGTFEGYNNYRYIADPA